MILHRTMLETLCYVLLLSFCDCAYVSWIVVTFCMTSIAWALGNFYFIMNKVYSFIKKKKRLLTFFLSIKEKYGVVCLIAR